MDLITYITSGSAHFLYSAGMKASRAGMTYVFDGFLAMSPIAFPSVIDFANCNLSVAIIARSPLLRPIEKYEEWYKWWSD